MTSCTKDNLGVSSTLGPVSVKVASVTATTALFAGTIDLEESMLYMECGLIYSTDAVLSENNGTRVRISSIIDNNRFEEIVYGLPYNEYIYFAPYYRTVTGLFVVGDVRKFKTDELIINIEVDESSVDGNCIDMTCSVSGLSDRDKGITIGVCYSYWESNVQYGGGICREFVGVVEDKTSTITLYDLHLGTPCYYCYYTELNGVMLYGEERVFTVPDPYAVVKKDLNLLSAEDLSKYGTANCYVVSCDGLYRFDVSDFNDYSQSVESCTVLWESFGTNVKPKIGDLISGMCYKDGYIIFETSDTFKEGNAVIAAKDAQGTILWSWHIWFTDDPHQQIFINNAGVMMDRNLGATSDVPGDICSIGLVYQWGRKDPFITTEHEVESTIEWPSRVTGDSKIGSLSYAREHPTTRIVVDGNGLLDWLYYPIDSLWESYGDEKSVYDPCPVGWRVPGADFFIKVFGEDNYNSIKVKYDNENKGADLSDYSNSPISWFPDRIYHTSTTPRYGGGWVRKLWIQNESYGCFFNLGDSFRAEDSYVRCIKE